MKKLILLTPLVHKGKWALRGCFLSLVNNWGSCSESYTKELSLSLCSTLNLYTLVCNIPAKVTREWSNDSRFFLKNLIAWQTASQNERRESSHSPPLSFNKFNSWLIAYHLYSVHSLRTQPNQDYTQNTSNKQNTLRPFVPKYTVRISKR